MAITQWQRISKADQTPEFVILHDDDDVTPPADFINEVLSLMQLSHVDYHFSEQPRKGCQVIWDMRSRKTRPHVAWIESQPLQQLFQGSEGKKQLWQSIYHYLQK